MKTFLLWWTADHVQAVKKLLVLLAGALAYLLPQGSLGQQIALAVATGGLTDSTLGSIWKLLQSKAASSSGGAALKALLVLAALAVALPAPARAQVQVSSGPTLPLLEVRPGNPHPVSLAPGAGYQLSFTTPAFQRLVGDKVWDLLDLNAMLFGSVVSAQSGESFGALSAAVGFCTLSSLVCLGAGHDLVAGGAAKPGWFGLFSFSINVDPSPPPSSGESASPRRGNTLYWGR